jgi:hypothetical protein
MRDDVTPLEAAERTADAFAYAVWMVGNMDTPQDKAAWWSDFRKVWDAAGARVEAMHARGIEVTAGFEATGLPVPDDAGERPAV